MNHLFGFVYKSIHNVLDADVEDLVKELGQFQYELTCLLRHAKFQRFSLDLFKQATHGLEDFKHLDHGKEMKLRMRIAMGSPSLCWVGTEHGESP